MLELCKTVMKGVAEDKCLFEKELKKSLSWLEKDELLAFKIWVKEYFYKEHKTIIDQAFHPHLIHNQEGGRVAG